MYNKTAAALQYTTIDGLRFPLIICVIFIHSFGLPETVNLHEINYSAFSGMDAYNIIRIIVRKIASICNDVFFLFSGFLFFFNVNVWNKTIYFKKLKTRISTLLIPYLLWNTINVIVRLMIIVGGRLIKKDGDWDRMTIFFNELTEKGLWNIYWHYNTWGSGTNMIGWSKLSMGPFCVPVWFLQTLILLTVLTPIIFLFCKYLKKYGLIALGLLYYTGIWFSIPGFGISPIFFFTLGAYFGIYKKNLISEWRKHKLFWYVVSILTLLPSVYYDYDGHTTYNYFTPVFLLACVISVINIASFFVEKWKIRPNPTLTKATFFVYGVHTILVLSMVGRIFDIIFESKAPMVLTIRYFIVPIATAYMCVLIYCIMKKIMPGILGLLSGNR
jgi:hypothetical protein